MNLNGIIVKVAQKMIYVMHIVDSGSDLVRNLMRKSVSLTDAKSGVGRADNVKAVTAKMENEIRKASANNLMGHKN